MASKVATLAAGSRVYVVSDRHRVDEKKRFFLDPSRALLWAVMTEETLRPSPLTREENIAQTMATSLHEKLVRKARFPLNSEHVLAELTVPKDVRYINDYVTDAQFAEVESMNRGAVGIFRQTAPSFFKSSFIALTKDGRIDIDQTYENLANLGPDQLAPMDTSVIRVVGPLPFVHQQNYSIEWEQLWRVVIELLVKHGSDGLPNIKNDLNALLNSQAGISRIVTGQAPPGYDDCFDALIGPFNQTGTSCFMDSTLICLFGFKNSPFYQHMIVENARIDAKFTVCDNDRTRDKELRHQIQKLLREDVSILVSGRQRFHCTNLRSVLGALCTKGGQFENLSHYANVKTHDPAELYIRLVDAIGYSPITIKTTTYRARDVDGTDEISLTESIDDVPTLPPLRAGDQTIYAAAWPFSWQTEYDELPTSDRRNPVLTARPFMKTVREIIRADAVVVHIDRSYAPGEAPKLPKAEPAMINPLLTLFGDQPVVIPPETEEWENLEDFPELQESEVLAQLAQTRVNDRPISVQTEMVINGTTYVLKGVVYSPVDSHYASLLHCGNSWFNFDDLAAYEPISRRPVSDDQASILIQTRGTLLFYYPAFMGRVAPLSTSSSSSIVTPMQSLTLGGKK